jgi:hypothetical protein
MTPDRPWHRGPGGAGRPRKGPEELVRNPVHVASSLQGVHDIGESTALLLIQVGRNRGLEDDQCGVQGCVGEQREQVDEQVTGFESRRVGGDHVQCPVQAFGAVDLLRPDQRGQPAAVVFTVGLQRVQVESGPPPTSGRRSGSGAGPLTAHDSMIWLSASRCSPRLVVCR